MTTKVTITVPESNQMSVCILTDNYGKHEEFWVAPGDTLDLHIWGEYKIGLTIKNIFEAHLAKNTEIIDHKLKPIASL